MESKQAAERRRRIKPLYHVVRRALSPKMVATIRDVLTNFRHFEQHKDRLGYSGTVHNVTALVHPSEIPAAINQRIWKLACTANKTWRVRVTPRLLDRGYSSNQYFRGCYLTDHVDYDEVNGKKSAKLTVTLMLSPPQEYAGGAFRMNSSPKALPTLQVGDAVIFPGYTMHGVERVTRGMRHTFNAWYTGPEFK